MNWRFLYLLLLCPVYANAQGIDTATIVRQLDTIYYNDQMPRKHNAPYSEMRVKDSINQLYVTALIDRYGWPGKSFVGRDGNITVFLVIQHADLATQQKYLPLFRASVEAGESRPWDLALMEDRVLMRTGKKQMYGSQVVPNPDMPGKMMFYPIEDEKNVNARRAKMGLGPIEEYAGSFGIEYVGVKE